MLSICLKPTNEREEHGAEKKHMHSSSSCAPLDNEVPAIAIAIYVCPIFIHL